MTSKEINMHGCYPIQGCYPAPYYPQPDYPQPGIPPMYAAVHPYEPVSIAYPPCVCPIMQDPASFPIQVTPMQEHATRSLENRAITPLDLKKGINALNQAVQEKKNQIKEAERGMRPFKIALNILIAVGVISVAAAILFPLGGALLGALEIGVVGGMAIAGFGLLSTLITMFVCEFQKKNYKSHDGSRKALTEELKTLKSYYKHFNEEGFKSFKPHLPHRESLLCSKEFHELYALTKQIKKEKSLIKQTKKLHKEKQEQYSLVKLTSFQERESRTLEREINSLRNTLGNHESKLNQLKWKAKAVKKRLNKHLEICAKANASAASPKAGA